MRNWKFWQTYYRQMEQPGWCGPAVVDMTLSVADIHVPQSEIAKFIYKDWWGTPNQLILAYLSKFFNIVNYKINGTFKDISYHLKKDHIVILNWFDDIVSDVDPEEGGHYSIAAEWNNKDKIITLADPSGYRYIWDISAKEFRQRWYDYLDVNNRTYIAGWMLWIDPTSKK